jgi:hypothetical protein
MTRSQFDDAGWPDKWARVQRGYQRVELIRLDPPAKGDADEPQALDDVLRFFTNCNHLADWLKNDRVDPHPEAMNFARKDPDLLICRDLTNGDKHCVLEARFHPTYPDATTTAEVVRDSGGRARWWIEVTRGDRRDVFAVAARCMDAWSGFIGRLPKPPGSAR